MTRPRLYVPLLMVSTSTIGLEVVLLRYFSVTSWSSFGAMVIAIALLGFAASGTLLTLAERFFAKNSEQKLVAILVAYVVSVPLAFLVANTVDFNPNKMLNVQEIGPEILHLTEYFALFFVPFFLAGLFTGMAFQRHHEQMGTIYFFDLVGAGLGSAVVLAAMFVISPFSLAAVVFTVAWLGLALLLFEARVSVVRTWALLLVTAAFLPVYWWSNHADYKVYKPIRQAEMVSGNESLLSSPVLSPLGIVEVQSNATEKPNLPLTDDFVRLVPGASTPERYPGLYLDGNRADGVFSVTADNRFVGYSLDAAPYLLTAKPDVLILGIGGGFTTYQALALGARHVNVIESNPQIVDLLKTTFAEPNGGLFLRPDVSVQINDGRSFALRDPRRYDLIEISDSAIAARPDENYLLTTQAFQDDLGLLRPQGLLTLSVDVSDNFFYALRVLATLSQSLREQGLDPGTRLVVLRSLFRMEFLVKPSGFAAADVQTLRQFSSNLGFDAVWFPGATGTEPLFSAAPWIPLREGEKGREAKADHALLGGDEFYQTARLVVADPTLHGTILDFRPLTDDRPYLFSLLKPFQLGPALATYELGGLPPQELNSILLVAEEANVVVFALLIVLIPWVVQAFRRRSSVRLPRGFLVRNAVYFACLGLGFFLIEVVLIQKLALFLGDPVFSFTLVLASLLIFAGVGSFLTERVRARRLLVRIAAGGVACGVALLVFWLPDLIRSWGAFPFAGRLALSMAVIAPVGLALGVFFPVGLSQLTGPGKRFLPWAWSINGAFSVVSTITARLLSQTWGFSTVLAVAVALYLVAALVLPHALSEGDAPADA